MYNELNKINYLLIFKMSEEGLKEKVISLWSEQEVQEFLKESDLSGLSKYFSANKVNGYDLCTLKEDLGKNENEVSPFDINHLNFLVQSALLEQLSIVINHEGKKVNFQLDDINELKVEKIATLAGEVFGINGKVILSTLDNFILLPDMNFVKLLLLNPEKYKTIKVYENNPIRTQTSFKKSFEFKKEDDFSMRNKLFTLSKDPSTNPLTTDSNIGMKKEKDFQPNSFNNISVTDSQPQIPPEKTHQKPITNMSMNLAMNPSFNLYRDADKGLNNDYNKDLTKGQEFKQDNKPDFKPNFSKDFTAKDSVEKDFSNKDFGEKRLFPKGFSPDYKPLNIGMDYKNYKQSSFPTQAPIQMPEMNQFGVMPSKGTTERLGTEPKALKNFMTSPDFKYNPGETGASEKLTPPITGSKSDLFGMTRNSMQGPQEGGMPSSLYVTTGQSNTGRMSSTFEGLKAGYASEKRNYRGNSLTNMEEYQQKPYRKADDKGEKPEKFMPKSGQELFTGGGMGFTPMNFEMIRQKGPAGEGFNPMKLKNFGNIENSQEGM